MSDPARYHPLQVVLHWLSAVLVIFAWIIGAIVFERIPTTETAQKIFALRGHMTAGLLIAFIVTLRLALRFSLDQPPRATSGNAKLDRLALAVHYALYVAVFGMAASGLTLAVQAGLPAIVFGNSDAPLPANFWDFPPRAVHAVIGTILISLVALHGVAALYHQFVRKDGLLRRMWFSGPTG